MFRSFRSSSTTRSPSSLGGSESQSVSSLGSDGLRSSSNLSTTKRGVSNFELPTPHSSRNQQPATRLKSILKCTDSVPPTSTKTYESSDRSVHTHSSNMSSNSRRTNSGKSTVNGNNSNSQHTRKSVRRIHHHVGFNTVEVREYARTVGDNPSVSAGPPISLDWDYNPESLVYAINDYEALQRSHRRSEREMALPRALREDLLRNEWGVTNAQLAKAVREALKCKNQRRNTIHHLQSGWNKVDQTIEKSGTALFRNLNFGRRSDASMTEAIQLESRHKLCVEIMTKEEELYRQQHGNDESSRGASSRNGNSSNPLDDDFDYAQYYTMHEKQQQQQQRDDYDTPEQAPLPSEVNMQRLKAGPSPTSAAAIDEAKMAALAAKLWGTARSGPRQGAGSSTRRTGSSTASGGSASGNGSAVHSATRANTIPEDDEDDSDDEDKFDEESDYFVDPDGYYHPHGTKFRADDMSDITGNM